MVENSTSFVNVEETKFKFSKVNFASKVAIATTRL